MAGVYLSFERSELGNRGSVFFYSLYSLLPSYIDMFIRLERLTSVASEFLLPMLKESKMTGMTSNELENCKIRVKSSPKPFLN